MSRRLGLEFRADTITAVGFSGAGRANLRTLTISWDPESPASAFAELREQFGSQNRISVAVDLSMLFVKRLELPPVPLGERRRILGLEPDRFFAVRGEELVFSLRDDDDLVFAARESLVTAWVVALRALGRVERIEPGPIADARALRQASAYDRLIARGGGSGVFHVMELRGGRLRWARRAFGGLGEVIGILRERAAEWDRPGAILLHPWSEDEAGRFRHEIPSFDVEPLPRVGELDSGYLTAIGTASEVEQEWQEGLLTEDLEADISRRRRIRLFAASVACAAALVFGAWSADAYRARTERDLDARIAYLRESAVDAMDLQRRADLLGREAEAMATFEAGAVDLLSVLLGLSRRLPEGAWIRTMRATTTGEWELDGYARDAAALIPVFENDPRFEGVRFRSATSRTLVGTETYENFSLALRTVRAP